MFVPWKKSYDKPRQCINKQRHHFTNKGSYSQSYCFFQLSCMDVRVGPEGWTLKNGFFRTVVLEKTLYSPLDSKEVSQSNPKGNQPWIFTGGTDAEAPILWSPDAKSQLIGKDPGAGKDWGQEEKGMTKDEMVGWHHWLNGHEFEQTLGESEEQRSRTCCSPWGCRVTHDGETEQQQCKSYVLHLLPRFKKV